MGREKVLFPPPPVGTIWIEGAMRRDFPGRITDAVELAPVASSKRWKPLPEAGDACPVCKMRRYANRKVEACEDDA